ncbi:hypothetical protein BJY01DRAFT_208237 [Aspergillus pseudoustus]|uniref:Uncharacterized protein n=1 Tax=Aspergillus pseudoustus TaxID=1810923 RepID=A0ABR4KJC7_9EURO
MHVGHDCVSEVGLGTWIRLEGWKERRSAPQNRAFRACIEGYLRSRVSRKPLREEKNGWTHKVFSFLFFFSLNLSVPSYLH